MMVKYDNLRTALGCLCLAHAHSGPLHATQYAVALGSECI